MKTINLQLLLLLVFSESVLAQSAACKITGKIVPVAEYQRPVNVYTTLKNDGYPMTAFGFYVSGSMVLSGKKDDRDYCRLLISKTITVILSGQYPEGHFQAGQQLSLRHVHQYKDVWPHWPNRYEISPP